MNQVSPINAAILALQGRYNGENATQVATVVQAFKAAQAANKGQNASLFEAFLALVAEGATGHTVRKVGANIRASVTAAMRAAAHLPATKGKAEKGAPDFSTASVYAGIVADALEVKRDEPDAWRMACEAVDGGEVRIAVHAASGLFASKGALSRAVAKCGDIVQAREAHQLPALSVTQDGEENDPAILRLALEAARAEARALRDEVDTLATKMRELEVTEA